MRAITSRRTIAAFALALCLPLLGCGTQTSPAAGSTDEDVAVSPTESSSTEPSAAEPAETKTPAMARPPGEPLTPETMAEEAKKDLAERSGVAVDEITVVRNDEVTWRDGSIGCAEEGMNYTMALVPGQLVVLEADGATYQYHSAQGRAPFLCENPNPQEPLDAGSGTS